MDTNGDGVIDKEEFLAAVSKVKNSVSRSRSRSRSPPHRENTVEFTPKGERILQPRLYDSPVKVLTAPPRAPVNPPRALPLDWGSEGQLKSQACVASAIEIGQELIEECRAKGHIQEGRMLAFAMGHLITVDAGIESHTNNMRDLDASIRLIKSVAEQMGS